MMIDAGAGAGLRRGAARYRAGPMTYAMTMRRRRNGFRRSRVQRIQRSLYNNDELYLKGDVYRDVVTYTRALDSNVYARWQVILCPGPGAQSSDAQTQVINDVPDFLKQAPNYEFAEIRGVRVYYEPSVAPNENYPLRNGSWGLFYKQD